MKEQSAVGYGVQYSAVTVYREFVRRREKGEYVKNILSDFVVKYSKSRSQIYRIIQRGKCLEIIAAIGKSTKW